MIVSAQRIQKNHNETVKKKSNFCNQYQQNNKTWNQEMQETEKHT